MAKHTVLVVSLGVAMAACSVEHDCRPGTLFVRASLDGDAGSADAIVVHVHRDGHDDVDLAPFVRRQSGASVESFEITFGTYEAGASVTLDVVAMAHGIPVGDTTKTIALARGCTATDVDVTAQGVGGGAAGDMADDMSAASDLAIGDDLAQGPPADLAMAAGAPSSPLNVMATPFAGRVVRITWDAPTDNGTGAITGYTVVSSPAGFSMTTAQHTIDTGALGTGTTYTFKVYASNAAGLGAPGTSNAVIAGDVPSAPTNVHATAMGLQATIDWTASVANGYPVLDYTIAADSGGLKTTVDGAQTSAMVSGLVNGQSYHFTVTARNALGSGAASSASNAITGSCTNTAYSMYAADTTTVQYTGDANASAISYIEARHDVRPPPFVNRDTTGWALFHLADPPNGPPAGAAVVSVQFTLNVSTTISNPAPTLVEVWYSQDDGWRSSQVLTSNDVRRTQKVSHSPVPPGAAGTKLVIDLDVPPTAGAWDWSKDLADRYITVGVADADLQDQLSYVRFQDASAGATAVPLLKLTVCQ